MLGKFKMLVGSAVEQGMIKEYFSDLHWYGVHMLGTQVPVGGSNPAWDGSLDVLMAEKQADGSYKKYVVELKTKSGYGADVLLREMEASPEYLAQLGLYLKDLSRKKVTNEGCLFYVLLSDATFGHCVVIYCRYDEASDEVVAYAAETSTGETRELGQRLKLTEIEARYRAVDEAVAKKKVPKGEFKYKYDLTPEYLEKLSDNQLRKFIRGEATGGDWQIKYSRYKTKEEMAKLKAEYRKRHPRSKI